MGSRDLNIHPAPPPKHSLSEELRAVNEALLLSNVRQHELTEQAQKAEALVEIQKQLLERLVQGQPIESLLDFLAREMERQAGGGLVVAIHLMEADGYHFGYVAAPSLPAQYAIATRGMDARLELGCCSSAVVSRQPTIVRDFAAEKRWPAFTAEVVRLGLRGCFTTPILSLDNCVLATFALYYREPRNPSPQEQQLVDVVTATVAMAIEHSRTEQALRESEERFRAMADNISQLAWICDQLGNVTWYNQRWLDYTGLGFDEMKGWDWSKVQHPDHLDRVVARVKHSAETGEPWEDTFPLRGKDGEYRWFLSRAVPIRDATGNIVRWFGTNTDVTERREAEELIRLSDERYRSLVSVITNVPWTTDAEGRFVTPQIAWEKYTGQCWEDHRDFGWANALHPEDRAKVQELWERACKNRTLYESQGRLWHAPTKKWRYFVARATPMLSDDGTVREWVGTCTDLDDQKRAEEKLQHLLVNEQALRSEAERANRMKDEFLATVSHELRTPLNSIIGWANLVRRGKLGESETARAIETIARNAKAQAQLVEDILDVSRMITGKLRLEKERVDLASTISAAIDSMHIAAEAKGIQIEVKADTLTPAVSGDLNRLQQVVWNLLANAVKFTPAGGKIEVRLQRSASQVQIVVKGYGSGYRS